MNDSPKPMHSRNGSWYSITDKNSGSDPGIGLSVNTTLDLDDAFDVDDNPAGADREFSLANHVKELQREPLEGFKEVDLDLDDIDVDSASAVKPDGVEIERDPRQNPSIVLEEISLDGPPTLEKSPPPTSQPSRHNTLPYRLEPRTAPSTPKSMVFEEREVMQIASPTAPGIVISRQPSLDSDVDLDEVSGKFEDVSLSNSKTSIRRPVPRRIVVPPPASAMAGVQVSQSPTPSGNFSRSGSPQVNTRVVSAGARPISPGLPTPVMVEAATGRPRRGTGTNTQDVVSKTRPSHLPPKSKDEDTRHIKAWEEMMRLSRIADEQKKEKLRAVRLAREEAVENSIGRWEKEVLPDVKAALRDPKLRQLWWKGVPTKLRGRIWHLTLGNPLALSKDSYRTCLARATRAISSKAFPQDVLVDVENDVQRTLPALHLFHPETGPMYGDLKDLLHAWVVSRADEGLPGYVKGASTVGAMFLINMPADQAFISMRNLLDRPCMRSFYGGPGAKDDVEAYYRIFDTLLADVMPKVYFNFKQHTISPRLYLPNWLIPVFLQHLPFEACSRIWDVIMLEGDSFLFRTSIAILSVIEARLFFPDRKELLEVLAGENKAALEVARRENEVVVDLGARYEQYGLTEEALWERLEGTEWKDSTWGRLIQRELPDI